GGKCTQLSQEFRFHVCPPYCEIVLARTAVPMLRTSVARPFASTAAHDYEVRSAFITFQETAQEIWACLDPRGQSLSRAVGILLHRECDLLLHCFPAFVADDSQFGPLNGFPLAFRTWAPYTLVGSGFLE